MILITILKNIVRKVLLSIGILLLLFTGVKVFGDDRLDTCELLLRKASEQMKDDNQLIHDLENIIDELELQIAVLKAENEELPTGTQNQTGWYAGGGGGIFFKENINMNLEMTLLYKFSKSAIYLSGGYPSITLGYLHKINFRR